DSIVELTLQVVESYEEDIRVTLCNGATYEYNGVSYGESGLFDVLLMSSQGCDSIIHLQIDVVTEIIDSQEVQICTGGSYQFAGATISESGIYRDTVLSSAGCDSIIILDLQVVTTIESSESFTICEGDSVLIGGIYYSDQVILRDTFLSTQGCDSVITYEVIVQPGVQLVGSDVTICEGESVELDLQVIGSLIGPLSWSPTEDLSCSDCPNPVANPTITTIYEVSTPGCLGDTAKAEFTVVVEPNPELVTVEDQRIILGESVTLSASAEGAFTIDWYLGEDLLCTNCESILQQPQENTTYIVTAYSEFGCSAEAEVLVEISGDPCDIGAIKAPNAITPNGDGFNDAFIVNNEGDAQIILIQIFNRWGEIVFESHGEDGGWDGTIRGVAVNPGVYMYLIQADCAEIGTATLVGNVTVIR
ncbi:MAG: gliding motility-associated C-terminal domain-containing protein, partial [Saprospiraceae bacterium]|nr:gliding motility-associated C-terminal domain-containing protein [Saprospiraceae bacterium]